MLTSEQINDLHRFYWSERWPIRKIERHLHMGWKTIKKYLDAPAQDPATRQRASKLDPFKGQMAEWLEKDPRVPTAVLPAPPHKEGCRPLVDPPPDSRTRRTARRGFSKWRDCLAQPMGGLQINAGVTFTQNS